MDNSIENSSATLLFNALTLFQSELAANSNHVLFNFVQFCTANWQSSRSQRLQDLFVLFFLRSKKNGFFVEFGATDGVDINNTFLLEREYRWKGILAEPAKCFHGRLKSNRKVSIDLRCVWSESGCYLDFFEAQAAELSTITEFRDKDFNKDGRKCSKNYSVETVSLNDLLDQHKAPKVIDYLSIDTEGSEYQILRSFDFSKYDVKIITVEHNFCEPDRENIRSLLAAMGFIRGFECISLQDDWYIKGHLLQNVR